MTNEETNKDLLTEDNSNDLSLSEQQEVKAKPKLTNDMIYETFGTQQEAGMMPSSTEK